MYAATGGGCGSCSDGNLSPPISRLSQYCTRIIFVVASGDKQGRVILGAYLLIGALAAYPLRRLVGVHVAPFLITRQMVSGRSVGCSLVLNTSTKGHVCYRSGKTVLALIDGRCRSADRRALPPAITKLAGVCSGWGDQGARRRR